MNQADKDKLQNNIEFIDDFYCPWIIAAAIVTPITAIVMFIDIFVL